MKREFFVRKGKIKELDKSFDLKFWHAQPPEERIAALEEIRREYHGWEYGKEPRMEKVCSIIRLHTPHAPETKEVKHDPTKNHR